MTPKKPPFVSKKQLIFPLIAFSMAVAFVGLGIGADLPPGTGAEYMLPLIGFASFSIGATALVLRAVEHGRWEYLPGTGFALMVQRGWYGERPQNVVDDVEDAFIRWSKAAKSWDLVAIQGRDVIWVKFEPAPLKIYGREVAGYTTHHTRSIVVAYSSEDQPVRKTALAHEIGHIVQGEATKIWDEGAHHDRAQFFGIP